MEREFHKIGNKTFDINSIYLVTKLAKHSYRISMSTGEVVEIDGEDRCNSFIDIMVEKFGDAFIDV